MANETLGLSPDLLAYLRRVGVHEPPILAQLRAETAALPEHEMQIAPEEGAFLALLAELIGARRYLEVGTFTGYSSLSVALAMPDDGRLVCCDVSEAWTSIARRSWDAAGVGERVELRLGPAVASLDALLAEGRAGTFDMAFIDANKEDYVRYWERVVELVRPGGLIAVDNVLGGGRVIDPADTSSHVAGIRALNERVATDDRVRIAMIPIADGVTLARKR